MRKTTTMKTRKKHDVPCYGCGRHAREVDDKVIVWFCRNCFVENGNYNRYKAGLKVFKPMENIKVKDVLVGADKNEYIVTGKGEWINGDKYFPVKNTKTKKEHFIGDFFFVKKVEK